MDSVNVLQVGQASIVPNANAQIINMDMDAMKPVNVKWIILNRVILTMENVTANLDGAAQHVIVLVHS